MNDKEILNREINKLMDRGYDIDDIWIAVNKQTVKTFEDISRFKGVRIATLYPPLQYDGEKEEKDFYILEEGGFLLVKGYFDKWHTLFN